MPSNDHSLISVSEISPLLEVVPRKSFSKATKELFSLMFPVGLGYFLTVTAEFIVVVKILAPISSDALAASAVITASQHFLRTTPCMVLTIANTHTKLGEEYDNASQVLQQAWVLSGILAVPTVTTIVCSKAILLSLGQPNDIADMVQQYFRAYAWGFPASFLLMSNNQVALGLGYPRVSLVSTFVQKLLLLGLGDILVNGRFGLPNLGVAGFGYAAAISTWLGYLSCTTYLCLSPHFSRYRIWRWRKENSLNTLKNLMRDGFPVGVRYGVDLFTALLTTLMMGRFGKKALAASEVMVQCGYIITVFLISTSLAANTCVKDAKAIDVGTYAKSALLIGQLFSLSSLGAVILFPGEIGAIFVDPSDPSNHTTLGLIKTMLLIGGIGQVFNSVRTIAGGVLQGLKDTSYPMKVSAFSTAVIGVPLTYLFALKMELGANGILLGMNAGVMLSSSLLLARRLYRKIKSLIQSNVEPSIQEHEVVSEESAGSSRGRCVIM